MRDIRASLRFEWCDFRASLEPETPQHVVQHVIVLVPQPSRSYLQWHVPVAEVVTRPRELEWMARVHRRHRLGRGLHLDHPAIVRQQQIPAPQDAATFEKQPGFLAIVEHGAQTALRTFAERQSQATFRGARRLGGWV
jgi:hypothetical protein